MATFYIKQGDLLPVIEELLLNDDGTAINLSGATVKFHLVVPMVGNIIVNGVADVLDVTTGHVRYTWQTNDTTATGTYEREWEVTYGSGKTVTVPNDRLGYDVAIAAQGA